MATATLPTPEISPRRHASPNGALTFWLLTWMLGAALLAGAVPIAFSIATVFLFAGPHNWIEARYFLSRLPARWGKLRGYFGLAFAGIFGLTAAFASIPWLGEWLNWGGDEWLTAVALWNSAAIGWIATLVHLRSRQNPRRDWGWTMPVACLLVALNWLAPLVASLALVYLHPLMALWILDRELARSRSTWRKAYHHCLLLLPLLVAALTVHLINAAPLPGDTAIADRITRHAGASILPFVSSHLLVALHTFLEMVHYGVWLIAIPIVGLRSAPWQLGTVPLARRSIAWKRFVIGLLALGGLIAFTLWACFLVDYPTTREVYFTIALLHVLAEVPFLLRAL